MPVIVGNPFRRAAADILMGAFRAVRKKGPVPTEYALVMPRWVMFRVAGDVLLAEAMHETGAVFFREDAGDGWTPAAAIAKAFRAITQAPDPLPGTDEFGMVRQEEINFFFAEVTAPGDITLIGTVRNDTIRIGPLRIGGPPTQAGTA